MEGGGRGESDVENEGIVWKEGMRSRENLSLGETPEYGYGKGASDLPAQHS